MDGVLIYSAIHSFVANFWKPFYYYFTFLAETLLCCYPLLCLLEVSKVKYVKSSTKSVCLFHDLYFVLF